MGLWGLFSPSFSREKFSHFSSVFSKFFKKSFCAKISYLYLFQSFWKIKEHQVFENYSFLLHFSINSRVFPKSFSLCFLFKNFIFSHTWGINSKPIFRIFVLWEKLFVIICDHQEIVCDLYDHQVVFSFALCLAKCLPFV